MAAQLGDTVSVERSAKLEGKNMTMILAPKAQKAKKQAPAKEQPAEAGSAE